MPNPASTGLPHPSSYTDLGDGTVKDNVTGLIWQKAVPATQAFNWTDAQNYCATLTLAGRVWHLPTRIELLSIVDFTRTSPAIDTTAFPGTPGGKYHWTSSPWVVSQIATKPQYSWIVNFFEGLTSNAGRPHATGIRALRVLVPGRLTAEALYAGRAGRDPGQRDRPHLAAGELTRDRWRSRMPQPACAALALNGHTWRLPSIKEWSTLVNETPPITKVSPAIDTTTFPDTAATTPYWSSSLFNSQPATAQPPWVMNFTDGFTQHSFTMALVKCVR